MRLAASNPEPDGCSVAVRKAPPVVLDTRRPITRILVNRRLRRYRSRSADNGARRSTLEPATTTTATAVKDATNVAAR